MSDVVEAPAATGPPLGRSQPAAIPIAHRLAGLVTAPVVEVLLAPRCWITGAALRARDGGLAADVRNGIAAGMEQSYCRRCGLTLGLFVTGDYANPCGRCATRDLGVQRLARVGAFDHPLRDLVLRMKYGRRFELAGILGTFLGRTLVREIPAQEIAETVLAPIPLYFWRRFWRGFNQAEELACVAGKVADVPVVDAVARRRHTRAQALTDSAAARKENLRNAFIAIAHRAIVGKHLWLVDDVCTTGATLFWATRALRRLPMELRPKSINAAVLCVADKPGDAAVAPLALPGR